MNFENGEPIGTYGDGPERVQLTSRQLQVLRLIAQAQPFPPSIRELVTAIGCSSTNAVQPHIAQLEAKGLIVRHGRKARGIVLTPAGVDALRGAP